MAKKGKKYLEAAKASRSSSKAYPIAEAIELAKKTSIVKFDATLEVAFRLGVDPRKLINKSVVLLYCQTELVKLQRVLSIC